MKPELILLSCESKKDYEEYIKMRCWQLGQDYDELMTGTKREPVVLVRRTIGKELHWGTRIYMERISELLGLKRGSMKARDLLTEPYARWI